MLGCDVICHNMIQYKVIQDGTICEGTKQYAILQHFIICYDIMQFHMVFNMIQWDTLGYIT